MNDVSQIRTLAKAELITEPGFYAIPLEQHHDQPCDSFSVTSGILRTVELETPDRVWAFSKANPDRFIKPSSDALRMGQAMATYVEGGKELIEKQVRVLPANKPNRPTEAQLDNYEEGKASAAAIRSIEFWENVELDPRTIITKEQFDLITAMGDALKIDPAAAAALGGVPELTMAWRDPDTGIWCLSRPDQIDFSGMLSDYKKVSMQGRPFLARSLDRKIEAYGYDMQMGFAWEGFEVLTGNRPSAVGLVFQNDQPPHAVVLRPIEEQDLILAKFRNWRSLQKIKECIDNNYWPGPGDDIGVYKRSEWLRDRLLNDMQEAGYVPD